PMSMGSAMGRHSLLLGGLCAVCLQVAVAATPAVRTMYNDAFAREQRVRAALTAPDAKPAVLDQVRAVIKSYESVVYRYPTSSYSDNALWQAGRLALDAFARFGEPADRDAGVRFLRRLAAGYPSSKLAHQVPGLLVAIDTQPAAPKVPAPSEPRATGGAQIP